MSIYYQLTSSQKQIFQVAQFEKYGNFCGISVSVIYEGVLDHVAAAYAIKKLYNESPILKTKITVKDKLAYQSIEDIKPDCKIMKFSTLDTFYHSCDNHAAQTMPVLGPLSNVLAADIQDGHYGFFINLHHIISDAISVKIIIHSLEKYYNESLGIIDVPEESGSYINYIQQDESYIQSAQFAEDMNYWHDVFLNNSPTCICEEKPASFESSRYSFELRPNVSSQLKKYCQMKNVSIFALFATVLGVYFCNYKNIDHFNIGTSVYSRSGQEQNTVGMFVNTIVLNIKPQAHMSWLQNVRQTKLQSFRALKHCRCNYTLYTESIENMGKAKPVDIPYDVYLSYQTVSMESNVRWHSCQAILESLLVNIISRTDGIIELEYDYQKEKFNCEEISCINTALVNLLKEIITNDSKNIPQALLENYNLSERLTKIESKYKEKKAMFPGSFHQEKLWFIDKFERGELYEFGPSYHNIPIILISESKLDYSKIKKAVQLLLDKYDILSTRIVPNDDSINQYTLNSQKFEVQVIEGAYAEKSALIQTCCKLSDVAFRDGLTQSLFRAYYLHNASGCDAVLMVCNFMICDYETKMLISHDFMNFYSNDDSQKTSQNLICQYQALSAWQKEDAADIMKAALKNWRQTLPNPVYPLELPIDKPRAKVHVFENDTILETLDCKIAKALKQLCKKHSTEMKFIVLALFKIVLSKFANSSEINIGTSINIRHLLRIPQEAGPLSNFVVLSDSIGNEPSFMDIVHSIKTTYLRAYNNAIIPFDKLVFELNPKNDMSRTALFDVLFNYELDSINHSNFKAIELNRGWGKFDYNLLVLESADTLRFILTYNKLYYHVETAQRLMNGLTTALKDIAVSEKKKVSQIKITSASETKKILEQFNTYDTGYVSQTITGIFKEQCLLQWENIAVKCGTDTIQYGELLRKANQVSWYLRNHGCCNDDIIALYMDKSIDCITAILGVLLAGATYLPVSKDVPHDRISFMLSDSKASILITDSQSIVFENMECLSISTILAADLNCTDMIDYSTPDAVAYIIYTSGTTGTPKGVTVAHKNVCSLIKNAYPLFQFTKEDVWTMAHSYNFDFSVWELFGSLLTGGKLILVSKDIVKDSYQFRTLLEKECVTVLNQTPLAFNALSEVEKECASHCLNIKTIIFGGEALSFSKLQVWRSMYSQARLINMYGITETTVHVTFKEISDQEILHGKSNIGKPLPGYNVYLLDSGCNLMPIGVSGEICVGGTGVSCGYLNRPQLNQDKFILNPFGKGLLYRSGDLAKWLPDGSLEYLGRIDDQVKIRGFRIEIGEIESHIRKIKNIKDCAVVLKEDSCGDKAIHAYVAADGTIKIELIKEELSRKLPEYMVPAAIMQIDKIPFNANGKLDRNALPSITLNHIKTCEQPLNDTESILLDIFSEILCIENVGKYDNFFELGGHSLKATKAVNMIEKRTRVRLSLKSFFSNPTVNELGELIDGMEKPAMSVISCAKKQSKYRMSSLQHSMYLLYDKNHDSIAYNTLGALRLGTMVNEEKIDYIIHTIVQRHESLRTFFTVEKGIPYQNIVDSVTIQVKRKKIYEDINNAMDDLMRDFVKPFDLSKLPLIRFSLIEDKQGEMTLLFDSHHIIFDGISIRLFIEEFQKIYHGEVLGQPNLHYKDFSEWNRGRDLSAQKKYWSGVFKNEVPLLDLPFDYKMPLHFDFVGSSVRVALDKGLVQAIRSITYRTGITEFMIYLSALFILLYRYSSQTDIVIGIPISGRTNSETEKMFGMFVNTLALRAFPDPMKEYKVFLDEIKELCLKAYENQEYSFVELVDALNLKTDPVRNHLFDVMFAFQNTNNSKQVLNSEIVPIRFENKIAKFLLSVNVDLMDDEYIVGFEYSTQLFSKENIKYMVHHYTNILNSIIKGFRCKINELQYINAEETKLVSKKFNATERLYDQTMNIVDILSEQVVLYPQQIAIDFEDKTISYSELNRQSDIIANHIVNSGLERGDFVAVISERSINTIIAFFGILKAGAIYVPIDPSYPAERMDYILSDAKPRMVLTNRYVLDNAHKIDDILSKNDTQHLKVAISPQNIAYCLYTSGTTGYPKGVLIKHAGVCNLVSFFKQTYHISRTDKILQFANFVFDASIWEIAMGILCGATLVMVSQDKINDIQAFGEYFKNKGITVATLPPNFYRQTEHLNPRILITAGSEADYTLLKKVQGLQYFNAYGPTETTVCATCWGWDSKKRNVNTLIPIGKPIQNTQVYIMNGDRLCGIGMPGELCISGDGVAKGYLNQIDLNNEKFVPNPYNGKIMYRSGDLAKWLFDGTLVFLGRMDQQVKIRGFRIELGEIENAVRQIKDIKDCAITVKENPKGEKFIWAYLVSENQISINEIKSYLRTKIPQYMIPSFFIQIKAVPLNQSGKVDKKRLQGIALPKNDCVFPRTQTEALLCELFSKILEVDEISIDDNFFDIGGHSLKAAKLIYEIENNLGIHIELRDIFNYPTVRVLAGQITVRVSKSRLIPRAPIKPVYQMTSLQKRLFALFETKPENLAYNMPQVYRLTGDFQEPLLKSALKQMVEKHEILRTNFDVVSGEFVQIIHQQIELDYEHIADNTDDSILILSLIRPFDLRKDRLLRIRIINRSDYTLLFIDIHHSICDGVGMGTFLDELSQLYNGDKIPELPLQFKDYSEWINQQDLSVHKLYWLEQFSGDIPVIDLPCDYTRSASKQYEGAVLSTIINEDVLSAIEPFNQQFHITNYMFFVATAMILLNKLSLQKDIVIGSPINCRTSQQIETMLGAMINTIPLRGYPSPDKKVTDFINEIRQVCLDGYAHQEYPFDTLINELELSRDNSRNPLFDVMVVEQDETWNQLIFKHVKTELVNIEALPVKVDLSFNIINMENGIAIGLLYCKNLFSSQTANKFLKYYINIMKQIVKNVDNTIGDIKTILPYEEEAILQHFNNTRFDYSQEGNLITMLEYRALNQPEDIAVVFRDEQVSYYEFNRKCNAVSQHLINMGVGLGAMVAVIAERSIEMLIAIYAILKAGAAYVPIAPDCPKDRQIYMLKTCNARVLVICNTQVQGQYSMPTLHISTHHDISMDVDNMGQKIDLDNPIYCIFTSGTTGNPKGVVVSHRNFLNLIAYMQELYRLDKKDVILQKTSFTFDISTSEIFGWVQAGCRVVLLEPGAEKNPKKLLEVIYNYRITLLSFVPSMMSEFFRSFYSEETQFQKLRMVRYIISCGEALSVELSNKITTIIENSHLNVKLVNMYGPTETTVFCTYYECKSNLDEVPIGKPIGNTEIYILNKKNLCGIGIPGELCIAGEGVSKGYLNQPDLTNKSFVPNPYGDGLLYCSGDKAKWLPDGNILFLGRMDSQVKLHGYRIELEEIESALRCLSGVYDCVAAVKDNHETGVYLCAYIVANDAVDLKKIKNSLRAKLPSYMIPNHFARIDCIPTNSNGKVDRKLLPDIKFNGSDDSILPLTEKEQLVSDGFCKVLGVQRAGAQDGFFELGGDSIKAIRLMTYLNESGYKVSVTDIIQGNAVEDIAKALTKSEVVQYSQDEVSGVVINTPIIDEFLSWNLSRQNHFNQAVLIRTSLDADQIYTIMYSLIKQHDILKSIFKNDALKIQKMEEIHNFHVEQYTIDTADYQKELSTLCTKIQETMNLESGPLVKCALFHVLDGEYLLLCIHHLVIDGVSWRILMEDFDTARQQLLSGEKIRLPKKTASYIQWAELLTRYKTHPELLHEHDYWRDIVRESRTVKLFCHSKEKGIMINNGFIVPAFDREMLREAITSSAFKVDELLICALVRTIRLFMKTNIVPIGLEGHGRIDFGEINISRTIGWFTSIYPVIFNVSGNLAEDLCNTKKVMRHVPHSGIGYGLLKNQVGAAAMDILFNYMGEIDAEYREEETYYPGESSVPENHIAAATLLVNASIVNGALNVVVSADDGFFSSAERRTLTEIYRSQISEVVDFSKWEPQSFKSYSELSAKDLKQDDLDVINSLDL